MKQIFVFLSGVFFIGCLSYKTIPLKGTYSDGNFEAYSEKSKEVVWENIIEFFAKNGLSIKLIDRSSGLIISDNTSMTWTQENSKGVPNKKDAWIIIHKVINPANNMSIMPSQVAGEWNIRIKESEGKTLINVNLVNPYYAVYGDASKHQFAKGTFQSLGNFEKLIYEKIK